MKKEGAQSFQEPVTAQMFSEEIDTVYRCWTLCSFLSHVQKVFSSHQSKMTQNIRTDKKRKFTDIQDRKLTVRNIYNDEDGR